MAPTTDLLKIDTKSALVVHLVTTALLAAPFFLNAAPQHGWNCIFASTVVGLNLGLIAWTLKRLFQKKSIALATSVIVIKYAILLGALVMLQSWGWQMNFGFIVGLAALFPTLAYMAYKYTAVPV